MTLPKVLVERPPVAIYEATKRAEAKAPRHLRLQATTMVEIVASYVDHYFNKMLAAKTPHSGIDYDDVRRWHAVWVEAQRCLAEGKDLPELAAQDLDADLLHGNLDDFLTAEDHRRMNHVEETTSGHAAAPAAI